MARRILRQRRTRRWWMAGATLVAAVAFAVVFVSASSANLSGSTFEGNDGNLVVNTSGNTDWCTDFPAPTSPSLCSAPISALNIGVDRPSGSTDNSFGQGTKEDNATVTVVNGSIPPQKSDLTRFYEASELGSNNHVFLYLAWERTNNLGNANMDFEINQNGVITGTTACPVNAGTCTINRTNGDILVTYDFPGSGLPTLGILRWLTVGGVNPYAGTPGGPPAGTLNANSDCFSANKLPCWGDHLTLNSTNSEGAVDTGAGGTYDPIGVTGQTAGRQIIQDGFGEAAIDLTGANVITQSNGCQFGQATTFLKSRSSSSFTSEIKDFIAPVQTPLFENCGAIEITKTAKTPGSTATKYLSGATFDLCTNSDASSTTSCTAPSGVTNPLTTGTDGTVCVSGLTPGNYYVFEAGAPTGYAIDDTSTRTVNVTNGDCTTPGTGDSLTFTDSPLTDITASATSEAAGGTNSTITCQDSSNTDVGDSPQGPSESPSVSATGLAPGTYTCTIVVDP
jgi:Prealbumin-like fold domain